MKLKAGDMLIMDSQNGALSLQLIGRNDVPRVEREGRGWRDGATAVLLGADVAEFLDALGGTPTSKREIGNSGLSVKVEYEVDRDDLPARPVLVLSVESVYVRLTWPERTLLGCAVRDLAWRMFQ